MTCIAFSRSRSTEEREQRPNRTPHSFFFRFSLSRYLFLSMYNLASKHRRRCFRSTLTRFVALRLVFFCCFLMIGVASGQTNENSASFRLLGRSDGSTSSVVPSTRLVKSLDDPTLDRTDLTRGLGEDGSRDLRVKGIEQRIEVLKDLIARQMAAEEAKRAQEAKQAELTNNKGTVDKAASSTDQDNSPGRSSAEKNDPSLGNREDLSDEGAAGSSLAKNEYQKSQRSKPASDNGIGYSEWDLSGINQDWEGVPITSSPVNSFELANSLFLTRHYSQALRSYEELLSTNTDGIDQAWLRLLTGHCYRILGDGPAAERLYREVTSIKPPGYPHDHARWYLNHLSRRKQIESELEQIVDELNAYRQPNQ